MASSLLRMCISFVFSILLLRQQCIADKTVSLQYDLNLKQKNENGEDTTVSRARSQPITNDETPIAPPESPEDTVEETDITAEESSKSVSGSNIPTHSCDENDHPNILFILLDDMGWGDVSHKGGAFPTPNIDSLLSKAVTLDRHYVHLMCSPSRTQFLTGRYAMNLGFGVFQPWDDSEIGGIPIGQPTIANWLSEFGSYTTYAAGKWHLGYANDQLLPEFNGFHHFYGFYQGAIDYVEKTYNDIENGDIGVYDFFEDGNPDYTIIHDDQNTMNLYSTKIQEYLNVEGQKKAEGQSSPWYMYAALQSMHVPFPDIPEYADECDGYLAKSTGSEQYINGRKKYCALLLLTDKVVGEIINSVMANDLWEDTLIVFTTDNGGETARGASNYPFRGTKGEVYEGNTRVVTSISGGVIEKAGLFGQVREEIASNLDWTPTLLHFAGYLDCIAPSDYTWDGVNQYDMIMGNDDAVEREHLVLNIGDTELQSASMVIRHEGSLYKYMRTDSNSATDRWVYSGSLSDVWSTIDPEDGTSLKILDFVEGDEVTKYSQVFEDGFLFDLTDDESELYNLLNPELPHYDEQLNMEIISKCSDILEEFMADNELFSVPINTLHSRLDLGDPTQIADGMFVRPFLTNKEYKTHIARMFETEEDRDHFHSMAQVDLYLNTWDCPQPMVGNVGLLHVEVVSDEGESDELSVQQMDDVMQEEGAVAMESGDDEQSQNAEKELVVQLDEAGDPVMKKDVVNFVFEGDEDDDDDVLQADGMVEEEIIGQPGDALNPGKEKIYDDNSPLKWWMVMVPIAVVIVVIVMVLLCYWLRVGLGVCSKASGQKEEPEYEPVSQEEEPRYGSFSNAYDDNNFYTQDSVDRDDY